MFGHRFIPLYRFPNIFPMITSILLVQTVVFIVLISTGNMDDPQTWVRYGAYIYWRIDEGEWWRLISSNFLHINYFQYFIVGLTLYVLGPQLEWLMGRIFFLLFYVATGTAAYIGFYLFEISGIHAGGTGASYGILGFYLYLYLRKLIDTETIKIIITLLFLNTLTIGYSFISLNSVLGYLLALMSGCLLGILIIEIRRFTSKKHDDD